MWEGVRYAAANGTCTKLRAQRGFGYARALDDHDYQAFDLCTKRSESIGPPAGTVRNRWIILPAGCTIGRVLARTVSSVPASFHRFLPP